MGDFLDATAAGTGSNSYATVAEAVAIMRANPYSTNWDAAAAVPDAEDYVVDDALAALLVDDVSIVFKSGSGDWAAGAVFTLAGDETEYTVATWTAATLTATFTPGLVAVPADGAAVTRLTGSAREVALKYATTLLDQYMNWKGDKYDADQSLRWPRYNVYDPDGWAYDEELIPELLKTATCYFAELLLGSDRTAEPALFGQGLKKAKVGPISIEVDGNMPGAVEVVPQSIRVLLEPLGSMSSIASKGGSRVVSIRRA